MIEYLKSIKRYDSTQVDEEIKEILKNEEEKNYHEEQLQYAHNLN